VKERKVRSFAGRLTRRIVLVLLIIMGLTAFWLFALGSIFVLEEETYRHEAMIQATAENINHVISDVCVAVNNQMPEIEESLDRPERMAVTRSLFRNVAAHTSEPDRIAAALNEVLSEGNETNMFVTVFVGILDLGNGLMRYCNAGHDAPLLVGQGVGLVPCDANLPLGVMPGYRYTLQELTIERGTTIFLYTDGLNEAEDADHVQFGIQRVQDVAERLLEAGKNQPVTMVKRMAEEVHGFVGEAEQSDDLTMLAIKRSGEWKEESGEC
jgi:hypothetical protein